jgi:uncharacterized protein YxjI
VTPFPHAHIDRFTIRQRLKAVKNVYEVRVALPGDEEGELVAYVEQKTFALKEDLRFWADEARTAELFRIKARQRFDPRARYRVTDAEGAELGELGKAFRRSLTRSTWRIYSPDGEEIAWAAERSLFRSVLRRLIGLAGLIPLVGNLIELIPILYPSTSTAVISRLAASTGAWASATAMSSTSAGTASV